MATVIDSKEKHLDVDSISEYVREENAAKPHAKLHTKDLFGSASEVISVARAIKSVVLPVQPSGSGQAQKVAQSLDNVNNQQPDVLETLWPGVHQDFSHSMTVKRAPSYYLILGFVGGAFIALALAWSFTTVSSLLSNYGKTSSILSQNKVASTTEAVDANSNTGVRVPLAPTYEVKEGDTLAGIALQNYKHISPRLLDEICKANNLTDANVLNAGQKLILPEYHY